MIKKDILLKGFKAYILYIGNFMENVIYEKSNRK